MLPTCTDRRRSQAGLTLIEVLISMIILSIIGTMLVGTWISLQRASAFTIQTNNARATARDALSRVTNELRDAQPSALPTASPSPTYTGALLTDAQPMSATFYSVFNQPGAGGDTTGSAARRLTRIRLDTSGSTPYKTLYWERDANNNGVFGDVVDRKIILANNVVNLSTPDSTVSPTTTYTAVFRYFDPTADPAWNDNTDAALDLTAVTAIQIRLIIDANVNNEPKPVDVTATVLLRNARID